MLKPDLITQKTDNWGQNFLKLIDYQETDDNLEDLASLGLISPENVHLYPEIKYDFMCNPNKIPDYLRNVMSVAEMVSICIQKGVTNLSELTDVTLLLTMYDMTMHETECLIDTDSLVFIHYLKEAQLQSIYPINRKTVFSIGRATWDITNIETHPDTATFKLPKQLQKQIVVGELSQIIDKTPVKDITINVETNVSVAHLNHRIGLVNDYIKHHSKTHHQTTFEANLESLPLNASSLIITQLPKFRKALQNPAFANALHACVDNLMEEPDTGKNSINADHYFNWANTQSFVKDIIDRAPKYKFNYNNQKIDLLQYLQKIF